MNRDLLQARINEFALLLGLDLDEVSALIYRTGCAFARMYYATRSARIAEGNSLYWHWWLHHWNLRDRQMESTVQTARLVSYEDRWELYQEWHDPEAYLRDHGQRARPWEEVTAQINRSLFPNHKIR